MNRQIVDLQEQIDLLVDGELPDAQRALLFSAVEEQAGGWRRCALAYVEAQTVGGALASDGSATAGTSHAPSWWRCGGIAAAIAAAFLAGRMIDSPAAGEVIAGDGEQVEDFVPGTPANGRSAMFWPTVPVGGAPAYATHEPMPEFMLEALLQVGHRVRQLQRTVRLDSPGGAEIELPLVETQIVDMRPQAL